MVRHSVSKAKCDTEPATEHQSSESVDHQESSERKVALTKIGKLTLYVLNSEASRGGNVEGGSSLEACSKHPNPAV
ncbi:uncharacterized protein RAG0_16186 [Rhynchosporium agropyri]|uniref:Uncharacterized protein n=2 Tax=Rhynchosporium TaxID=38037 RepID=A0A1E1MT73_RHYSE|nr:uncharacterized protein RAG0_16186 [Rhynchosporium agropyri]CZT52282.1 uncharacterized protein RSE6_13580 [Rhynchosporium secalis]